MKADYIWMDGELVPFAEAKVHILNPTMHYGTGVFEGIRSYNTPKGAAVFRLKDHMKRFLNSIKIVGIRDFPFTFDELIEATFETLKKNNLSAGYIRPLMYMEGPLSLSLEDWIPHVSIAAWEWAPLLGEDSATKGVKVVVSSFTRHHPNVMMTKAKTSGNYVNSTLAKTLSVRLGFDEAIMLDPEGFVAECTGENLFIVRDNEIISPPTATILEGITRDSLIHLASDLGYNVREEPISRDQLYIADEVFLCGTAAEVVPVSEIDTRQIGDGQSGPVTRALQAAFKEILQAKEPYASEWLDFIP